MISVLTFPNGPDGLPRQGFLDGFPFLGTHARVIRRAIEVLKLRDALEVQREWEAVMENGISERGRKEAFTVIGKYIHWPTYAFVPADRAVVVLGCIPGVWFDPDDLLRELCELRNTKVTADVYLIVMKGSLLEALQAILRTDLEEGA